MTWDDVTEWFWHLFNDPMRDNVWSLAGAILIAGGGMGMLYLLAEKVKVMRFRRRNKGDGVTDDKARAAEAIDRARTHTEEDENTHGEPPTERIQQIPRMATGMAVTGQGAPASSAYYFDEPEPAPIPVADSGVHALPTTAGLGEHRIDCTACGGTGYMTRSTNDLLRESLALVGDGGDIVVKEFYTRLLHAAPDLASLFPPDLLTAQTLQDMGYADDGTLDADEETKRALAERAGLAYDPSLPDPREKISRGMKQRERLLGALVALANSYNPDDQPTMDRLDTALASFGRSHAAFARPDGTVQGATLDEYAAVKSVLFETLVAAAGAAWLPAYTVAWSEAYDYAAATMMHEQHRAGFRYPRAPRA